ncbi:hypothetical protein DNT70_02595, partial [Salmonella enterica subsp. enterica serovar Cerro]|nr:hypothetical protein [Salmonella enterica subsp. enterica serovar Cerro]
KVYVLLIGVITVCRWCVDAPFPFCNPASGATYIQNNTRCRMIITPFISRIYLSQYMKLLNVIHNINIY